MRMVAAATQSSGQARAGVERTQPRALASARALSREELIGAPLRWPRPARLRRPLELPGARMGRALESLGVRSVGDLLEHLPSDSRQARTVAALRAGEQATVAVQVRAIASRPVRRRGMRPLVQATVADATGSMRATFFNQPWLVQRYQPGTPLLLHGKADGHGGFRVVHHAIAGGEDGELQGAEQGSAAVAHYPAAEGISSTQILTLVRGLRPALAEVEEPLPALVRAREGLPDRPGALAAVHFPRDGEDAREGRQRLAFEELLLAQLVFLQRRTRRRERAGARVLDERPSLRERWL